MMKFVKYCIILALSVALIVGIVRPIVANTEPEQDEQRVGSTIALYLPERGDREPELSIGVMPEAGYQLVNAESIAVYQMYSIMETMVGSDMQRLRSGALPFLSGFQIESIIPVQNYAGVVFAYAVNFVSNCGTPAFVVVGTKADMPPVVEFSLWERFGEDEVLFPMWVRGCQNELEMLDANATIMRDSYPSSVDIMHYAVDVYPVGFAGSASSHSYDVARLTRPPTEVEVDVISEWHAPWLITLSELENFDVHGFMSAPFNYLSADTIAEIQNSAALEPLSWGNIPGWHLPVYRTMNDLRYRHNIGIRPNRLQNHCGPTAAMNLMLYYQASGRIPFIFTSRAEVTLMTLMYLAMATNAAGPGTIPSNFVWGLRSMFSLTPGLHSFSVEDIWPFGNNWATFADRINRGYPTPLLYWRDNWYRQGNPGSCRDWSWHWVLATGHSTHTPTNVNSVWAADGWLGGHETWCPVGFRNVQRNTERFRTVSVGNNAPADRQIHVNAGWMN